MNLPLAALALAATYQQCTAATTCTIGEYLYNDSYQPQTGAVCTLTAKYPDGTGFVTASASATTDGWYYYDAAIGTTTGLYPANFCCTSGSDYLCLDKSFEVKAAAGTGLTAADVWAYSSRTLTGFGDLAKDVWSQSTRTLTSFGDLVASLWTSTTTTTTASPAPLTLIMREQSQQRELLEKLVNAPVVSLSLEEGQTIPDLNSKLEQSRLQAETLYESVQSGGLIHPEIPALTKAWDDPIVIRLNLAASLKDRRLLQELVGQPNDDEQADTLFGWLARVSRRHETLKAEEQKLAALLEDWNGQGEAALTKNVSAGRRRVLALNQFPGGDGLIGSAKLKNVVFNLRALLGLNLQLLALNPGEPIRSLWLTEGSIIFRGVITNPSTVISQTVPLKFYLPRELTSNDILSLDPSLETHYDTTEEALYVTGSYTLKPEETRLIAVEVEDIWKLADAQLESLRKQAAELLKPLEKTSYLAQGTVLKSEIEVTLDKILLNQNKAITPENRIRAYREARLELNGIDTNMNRLQDLVAQAAGTGSLFGFVGGVQAVAVWGILLIVIASFVFLTIYMRQLKLRPQVKPQPKADRPVAAAPSPLLLPAVAVATAIVTVVITQLWFRPKPAAILELAPPSPVTSPEPAKPAEVNVRQEKQVLGASVPKRLSVPGGSSVNIRSQPGASAPIIMTVKASLDVYVFEQKKDWSRIGFGPEQTREQWWVSSQFLD